MAARAQANEAMSAINAMSGRTSDHPLTYDSFATAFNAKVNTESLVDMRKANVSIRKLVRAAHGAHAPRRHHATHPLARAEWLLVAGAGDGASKQ